jgi:hypothetical protein
MACVVALHEDAAPVVDRLDHERDGGGVVLWQIQPCLSMHDASFPDSGTMILICLVDPSSILAARESSKFTA